jgi:hypothetical protein
MRVKQTKNQRRCFTGKQNDPAYICMAAASLARGSTAPPDGRAYLLGHLTAALYGLKRCSVVLLMSIAVLLISIEFLLICIAAL